MKPFASWYELLCYLDEHHNIVHYKAALDRYPVPVVVIKRFKNGKLRCQYRGIQYTADPSHLDRFLRKQ